LLIDDSSFFNYCRFISRYPLEGTFARLSTAAAAASYARDRAALRPLILPSQPACHLPCFGPDVLKFF
jgi:hypothetical protein